MSDPSPVPVTGPQPAGSIAALRVEPAALVQFAGQLQTEADSIRSGTPLLQSAWAQAASELSAESTGGVLGEVRAGAAVALDGFAASVESLARSLRSSAQSYAHADEAALPPDSGT